MQAGASPALSPGHGAPPGWPGSARPRCAGLLCVGVAWCGDRCSFFSRLCRAAAPGRRDTQAHAAWGLFTHAPAAGRAEAGAAGGAQVLVGASLTSSPEVWASHPRPRSVRSTLFCRDPLVLAQDPPRLPTAQSSAPRTVPARKWWKPS